jgi:Flp pilus assembly protein TadG
VSRSFHSVGCLQVLGRLMGRADGAAQLVEFAVSLPLLVIFVVGIFDFSGAFTLKQKLTNIARDAARVAAADPAGDLTSTSPTSVIDAFQVVRNYLAANAINDCGITSTTGTKSQLTWTFTANGNGCPSPGITLIVNRGYYFAPSAAGQPVSISCQPASTPTSAVIGTCVSLQYNYPWRFGRLSYLFGQTAALPSSISAAGVAMNEN